MNTPDMQMVQREILVVGAGPVGLVTALALRSHGWSVTVLEARSQDQIRPGSRAIFVHRDSLKLIERMKVGLGLEIASHGLVWPTRRTLWHGKSVFVRHYPAPDLNTLPPFTSLPQTEIERYLLQACEETGVEFIWNTPVTDVVVMSGGVKAMTGLGTSWAARYLIGADGAHSVVRRAIGVTMEGEHSPHSYVVVDVEEDANDPLPSERIFHYRHPAVDGRNILFVPFAGGWRVDLQCRDTDEPGVFSSVQGIRQWLPKVMPSKYVERITWVSTYQFLQMLARDFTDQHRRVLLIGEAAHLFAPFGARGMNSGMADSVSAALAIDTALKASHSAKACEAIELFVQSRYAAAEYNRAAAAQALAHVQTGNPLALAKRELAAFVAPHWKRVGAWLDSGPYGPRTGPTGQVTGKY